MVQSTIKYDNGVIVSEEVSTQEIKSVYTKTEFLDLIPKNVRQQIRAEEQAGDGDMLDWTFIVTQMNEIDLNNLPSGFVEGLDSMPGNPNISVNQAQVDAFLER